MTQVCTPLSALVCLGVCFIYIRRPKYRKFPDNFAVISCGTLLGALCMDNIRIWSKGRETNSFLCYFEAIGLQFFRTQFVWNWNLSMIVLYLVTVRKIPVRKLRSKSHWYYSILGSITLLFTILPAIFGKYGALRRKCYITGPPGWRLSFGYCGAFLFHVVWASSHSSAVFHPPRPIARCDVPTDPSSCISFRALQLFPVVSDKRDFDRQLGRSF